MDLEHYLHKSLVTKEAKELKESSHRQVYTELTFYLWRVRWKSNDEWFPRIMINGSKNALSVMYDAIQSMREDFRTYGKSTRKFLCNPPEDIDVIRYAKENNAEIEWQIWLILRMEPDVYNDSSYELKNKAVTLRLNDQMAEKLLQTLDAYRESITPIGMGLATLGGLFFTNDWLGIQQKSN